MTMPLAGRAVLQRQLESILDEWQKGRGAVHLLASEQGMGKSTILQWVASNIGTGVVQVECRPPIGSYNVSSIQPLQPFGYAIEQIYTQGEEAAKKRLALNVGMSLLTAVPLVGDMIYAVKAIRQDVSEYKRETAATQAKKLAAVDACVATLLDVAQGRPLALLVDDGHWADSQSIEVVRKLVPLAQTSQLLLLWAYTPSVAKRQRLPIDEFVSDIATRATIIAVEPVDRKAVADIVAATDATIAPTENQLDVLFDRSGGSPGIIAEYVRYLRRTSMVDANGNIDATAFGDVAPRLSEHPATDAILASVSPEDAITLALAAAEGREFTAWMMAELMNTDVLTAIRTIRRLQRSTGFITSQGMRTRYGVRTTVYEFTQSVAYTFYLHYPEFEERRNIHQRIADILSQQQRTTPIDEVRHQIAPFIVAHSAEAEDDVTAQLMLKDAEVTATLMGAFDIAAQIRAQLRVSEETEQSSPTAERTTDTPTEVFGTSSHSVRHIADALVRGEAHIARQLATDALASAALTHSERVVLLCLGARACIEQGALNDAQALLESAERGAPSITDQVTVLNQKAILAMHRGNEQESRAALMTAASMATSLDPASRILTMANIVALLRKSGDPHAERFARQLRRMTAANGWHDLRTDLAM